MKRFFTPLLLFSIFLYSCDRQIAIKNEVFLIPDKNPIITEEEPEVIWSSTPPPKKLIDDAMIYELINSCMATDTSYFKMSDIIIGTEFSPIFSSREKISKADSIFKKEDVDFIYEQARYGPLFKIDERKLKIKKNIILPELCDVFGEDQKEYWENIHNQFGSFTTISMPLFSRDHKTAIISLSYDCGMMCGYSGKYIYKKTASRWQLITVWADSVY
ncbi:hypothetical protein [Flavobacterium psychrotrophum]|uniref:hypothetical protein n=1 Tax=Flavobacterium psychrotrophum TaxID=2294119 RepID=UPI000E312EEC|nr:hypothetical protein [Flavobacterium psychrotrophum]